MRGIAGVAGHARVIPELEWHAKPLELKAEFVDL